MITVDIKTLISRLGPFCTRALEGAAGLCVGRSHYEVTVEHLLAKFLEEPQSDILSSCGSSTSTPARCGRRSSSASKGTGPGTPGSRSSLPPFSNGSRKDG